MNRRRVAFATTSIAGPLPMLAAIGAKTALLAVYLGVLWMPGVLTGGERDLVRLLLKSPRAGLAALRR